MKRASRLTTSDLTAVADCSRQLLSILDDPNVDSWAQRVIHSIQPVLGADRVFAALPSLKGFTMHHTDTEMHEAAVSYGEYYHTTDVYVGPRRRALGLDVYSFDMVISVGERNHSEFWNSRAEVRSALFPNDETL
jgi:hypothetical protein